MTNQQGAPEAPKSTALDGKTELFNVLGHPLLVRAVDFNRLYAEKERLAALVEAQQPAPSAAADLIAALEEARSAINSMKVEAETAGQGDEQMMLEACETISNEGLQADIAIRAALASASQPSTAHQADSRPAPVWDYPPLPDFDTVEQHIYGACRRYITQDMLEPIHNLIRDAIDADRALADSVTAPAGEVGGDVDAIALSRYKVVSAHESMFHRFAVVAGDGKQQLFLGREVECENMARKFAGAFLGGAFYQANIAPTPPAQAADSVLEDAARLDWLESNSQTNIERVRYPGATKSIYEVTPYRSVSYDGETLRAAIDAARKHGGAI